MWSETAIKTPPCRRVSSLSRRTGDHVIAGTISACSQPGKMLHSFGWNCRLKQLRDCVTGGRSPAYAGLTSATDRGGGASVGLFRHYWVLYKFLITTLATLLLLVHMRPVAHLARVAAETTLSSADLHRPRVQLVGDASAALLALLVTTTLSVYKPGGVTAYGRRKHHEQYAETDLGPTTSTPLWVYMFGTVGLILLIIIRHVTMLGHAGHGH